MPETGDESTISAGTPAAPVSLCPYIAFVDAKEDSYWLRLKTEIGSYDRDQYLANLAREVGLRLVERVTDSVDVVAERPVSFWRRRFGEKSRSNVSSVSVATDEWGL